MTVHFRKIPLVVLAIFFLSPLFSQVQTPPPASATIPDEAPPTIEETPISIQPSPAPADKAYEAFDVTKLPVFPGGEKAMLDFMNSNIQYPDWARQNKIQGLVVLLLIIDKEGNISEAQVIRDIGGGCAKEAARVARTMPKWTPGEVNGLPVKVRFTIPVRFSLDSQPAPAPATPNKVYELYEVQTPPAFPGGEGELNKYLYQNLEYPADARKNNIQGAVVLRFDIDKTGAIGNVTIVKGVHQLLDDAAKAVIRKLPNWAPAQVDGQPVACRYTIPIVFKLN